MDKPVTFAICGLGIRGLEAYAAFQKQHPEKMKITAGADPDPDRRAALQANYGVPAGSCFATGEELLAQPRLADVMIIATQDRQHVAQALAALDKGYHLVLEKPISPLLDECLALQKKAHEANRVVVVCHVLRYTKFYGTLYELLRGGAIGRIESLDAVENVAYWHYAHSYVRGNWRRAEESSPMILAKSCHDMDIIRWLMGVPCESVSSYGSLDWFRAENAPDGSADRCLSGCACKEGCPYDAEKIYIFNDKSGLRSGNDEWPCSVLVNKPTEEKLYDALRTGPYGRCVYRCDNDVVDHQVVSMRFAGGATATFTMSAFTAKCYRSIKVMGTMGEIEGDMDANVLYLRKFGQPEQVLDLGTIPDRFAGHGGGDALMMDYVCELIAAGGAEGLTSVVASVESHVMALAAEHSRTHGGSAAELAAFTEK